MEEEERGRRGGRGCSTPWKLWGTWGNADGSSDEKAGHTPEITCEGRKKGKIKGKGGLCEEWTVGRKEGIYEGRKEGAQEGRKGCMKKAGYDGRKEGAKGHMI